ncbi:3-beta hydroxysteroid dehydrogenase/isomerase family protein [Cristinia sonorae]|uniref:3-beta hydroxysteroid dehydrogenase/isomerase family protein n=1 Tax=Cristinia sonorae TaxID=1940300 RepID=A0A8K0UQB0_9AGAR|nr:3-beta hydroxysteroid dehydrogenase/isomerase family protein [Cristinia sonorae]
MSTSTNSDKLILATGVTGFIGAHVLDELLRHGYRVRATTRSKEKGDEMLEARPDAADRLEFVVVGDLTAPDGFDAAVKGVDGIIHCAAPVADKFEDGEKDVMIPAIEGTKAMFNAAAQEPKVKRLVMTSSFATVLDASRGWQADWTYTAEHWNPITYDEAKVRKDIVAYRGAKKYSELYAWDYIRDKKPHFDLVTIIPPMVYGPIAHPISDISKLNMSNMDLWTIASGKDYPEQRVPFWVDVRDLALAHVLALEKPEASNRRFIVTAPEKFSHEAAANIMREEFTWAKDVVKTEKSRSSPESFRLDGWTASKELGFTYRAFKESVVDSVKQFKEIAERR